MPGNRPIYDRAMEQSREAARLKRWDEALKNAARALQEFPHEIDARTSVAIALFHTGKLDQSLQMLQDLHSADPDNPYFLEHIARAQERQGNTSAAIKTYHRLLEIHENQQSTARTIEVLRELLRLDPKLDPQREHLAHLLKQNRPQDAAAEYLQLAHNYQQQHRLDEAAERAEEALRLNPDSRETKEFLIALRNEMANDAGLDTAPTRSAGAESPESMVSHAGTGALRSQQFTLEKLVADAVDKQEAGDSEGAIAAYEQVIEAGLERSDVFYSLGLLYQERNDHEAAVRVLQRSYSDPEYALSAHFALGSSYTELQKLELAAQEYEQAINLVDLATVGRTESEDLIQMYEQVCGIYQQIGDVARAASLYSTLANFLRTKRWGRERAEEFTKRAKELTDMNMLAKLRSLGTGALGGLAGQPVPESKPIEPEPEEQMPEQWGKIPSIIDFLRSDGTDGGSGPLGPGSDPLQASGPLDMLESLPPAETTITTPVTPLDTDSLDEKVALWVTASGRYIEQGLYDAAMDACYEVMLMVPEYLPIHLRMGEIFERQYLTEEALAKYQTLIDTFTVRNEGTQAIDVYYRYIALSPDTTNARSRLAELLHKAGRDDDAAEQLGAIADNYFRIGQTNRAMEEYRRGLQWSPKNKDLRAQYGLALFKMNRYEAALSEFHKAADPHDPVSIAHINMALAAIGDQPASVWDSLGALLEHLDPSDHVSVNTVQTEYRSALLVNDDPLIHYILGIIQQHCNQHSSALLELEQSEALLEAEEHPLVPRVLVHQAQANSHIKLDQAEEALHHIQRANALAKEANVDPAIKHSFAKPLSQGELIWQMAEAFAANDDLVNAEQALREASRLLPTNQNIYTKLADVCFRQGKLDEAISSLATVATNHENRQDLDQAIQILEYALKLAPGNVEIGGRLARLYIRRGYPDKGVEGLIRVAEQQRKNGYIIDAVASLQQAGEIRWMQGKADETLQIYDRIVQIAPADVEARQWRAIMYTLAARTTEAIAEKKQIANILAQRKDYDNAIAELHQIIGLDTADTDAYYMLGDMLMRRGEYTQALNLYTRMSRMETIETERVEALIAAANNMIKNQQVPSS